MYLQENANATARAFVNRFGREHLEFVLDDFACQHDLYPEYLQEIMLALAEQSSVDYDATQIFDTKYSSAAIAILALYDLTLPERVEDFSPQQDAIAIKLLSQITENT